MSKNAAIRMSVCQRERSDAWQQSIAEQSLRCSAEVHAREEEF